MLVIFADAHLSERTWTNREIAGDSFFALEQIVDYAVEHASACVSAGDLLHAAANRPPVVARMLSQFERLRQAGVALWHIQGQHEMSAGDARWAELSSYARHLHDNYFEWGGRTVRGLDWQPTAALVDKLATLPRCECLIAHQGWTELLGPFGQCSVELADRANLVISGDVHVHKMIDRASAPYRLISPGATHMRSVAEQPDKYFLCVDEHWNVTRRQLRSRGFVRIAADSTTDMDDLRRQVELATDNTLPEGLRMPVVSVTITQGDRETEARVNSVCRGAAHVFWRWVAARSDVRLSDDVVSGDQVTLASELAGYLAAKKLPELERPCRDLLNSTDLARTLRELMVERVV